VTVGLRRVGADLLIQVRLTPGADRDRIDGAKMLSDGETVLAARVRAVPEAGKANAAVVALIARELGVPKSRVSVEAGITQRRKVLRITGADRTVETAARRIFDG